MDVLYLYWFLAGLFFSEYVQLISDRRSFLKSIAGRSQCDHCHKEIPWYVLIPIIGRFFVKEHCPYCAAKIHRKYLFFEIMYGIFWGLFLFLFAKSFMYTHLVVFVLFIGFSATWLLVYEDLNHFSVPLPWFLSWALSYAGMWFALGNRQIHWLDGGLSLITLVVSIAVVVLMKKQEDVALDSLFGIADVLALLLIALILGFSITTYILVLALVSSVVYLLLTKKLKSGQRIPLLTMMLPWAVLALIFL